MQLNGTACLLRIFVGEADVVNNQYFYENILFKAKEMGLAGGTVLKGIMAYGSSSHVHRARLIELSEDMPIVIEIIDEEEKINNFLPYVKNLFDTYENGGMITTEKVNVHFYKPKQKK